MNAVDMIWSRGVQDPQCNVVAAFAVIQLLQLPTFGGIYLRSHVGSLESNALGHWNLALKQDLPGWRL